MISRFRRVFQSGKGLLYGPYHNFVSSSGVTALWNGYVGSPSFASPDSVSVVVDGIAASVIQPVNLVHAPSKIIFVASSTVTEEEAITK